MAELKYIQQAKEKLGETCPNPTISDNVFKQLVEYASTELGLFLVFMKQNEESITEGARQHFIADYRRLIFNCYDRLDANIREMQALIKLFNTGVLYVEGGETRQVKQMISPAAQWLLDDYAAVLQQRGYKYAPEVNIALHTRVAAWEADLAAAQPKQKVSMLAMRHMINAATARHTLALFVAKVITKATEEELQKIVPTLLANIQPARDGILQSNADLLAAITNVTNNHADTNAPVPDAVAALFAPEEEIQRRQVSEEDQKQLKIDFGEEPAQADLLEEAQPELFTAEEMGSDDVLKLKYEQSIQQFKSKPINTTYKEQEVFSDEDKVPRMLRNQIKYHEARYKQQLAQYEADQEEPMTEQQRKDRQELLAKGANSLATFDGCYKIINGLEVMPMYTEQTAETTEYLEFQPSTTEFMRCLGYGDNWNADQLHAAINAANFISTQRMAIELPYFYIKKDKDGKRKEVLRYQTIWFSPVVATIKNEKQIERITEDGTTTTISETETLKIKSIMVHKLLLKGYQEGQLVDNNGRKLLPKHYAPHFITPKQRKTFNSSANEAKFLAMLQAKQHITEDNLLEDIFEASIRINAGETTRTVWRTSGKPRCKKYIADWFKRAYEAGILIEPVRKTKNTQGQTVYSWHTKEEEKQPEAPAGSSQNK